MMDNRIDWPAFIKYAGDDELVLVADSASWQQEYADAVFDPADFLVDSSGRRIALAGGTENAPQPPSGEQVIDIAEIGVLLRNHFAALGECCIAKIPELPAAEALRLLQDTEAP